MNASRRDLALRTLAVAAGLVAAHYACMVTATDAIAPRAPAPVTLVTQVTDSYPALSPDGATLLFQSNRNGRLALYTAKPDGTGTRLLLDSGDEPVTATWSPDSRRIAFATTKDGDSDINVMNADGTGRRALVPHAGDDSHPHWSADGRRIFFNSSRTTPDATVDWTDQWHEVFSVAVDGDDLKQHTRCKAVCTYPVPSPDGKRIAYRKTTATPGFAWDLSSIARNSEVFVADLDGSRETNLSNSAAFDGWPMWSPDGTWIAFSSNRAGPANVGHIHAIRPDGTGLVQLTHGPTGFAQPSWSPDGREIYAYRYTETADAEFGQIARITVSLQ